MREPPTEPSVEQKILLNLGQGDWHTGFATVTAQLWADNQSPVQFIGSLPSAPQLEAQYQQWQQLYEALYGEADLWRRSGRASQRAAADFEFDTSAPTRVSRHEFETLCIELKASLNQWLMTANFTSLERRIRTQLAPQTTIRVMLTAHSKGVLRFPWQLWDLFEDYPNAELSVSLPTYTRAIKQTTTKDAKGVRILAVLGSDDGIDVETDREILGQLPSACVTLLSQPSLEELQQQLWQSSWDVLFFAGHSTSEGPGHLQVNATESLTIEQLKYALQRAIVNGLQLAILNSCDGLGLAWALADLYLPQTIVMREPVSDAIAQQFLKSFLFSLSRGQSLYLSVREAREKLHGRTELGSYAAWLPVIVQNPSEVPPTWQGLMGQPTAEVLPSKSLPVVGVPPVADVPTVPARNESPVSSRRSTALSLVSLLGASVSIATVVFGGRWLGWLQNTELSAYDTLLKLRPAEALDSRLVIITVDGEDIRSQTSLERRGSLSDETLQATLSTLLSYEPRVIGLDLYRDFPASIPALAETLARPEILGICKCRDPSADKVGIAPAPELPITQVGFSDFIEETDGILRRQLLTIKPDATSPCTSPYGFAALMAIHYLRSAPSGDRTFQPSFTEQENLKIGDVVFPHLGPRTGGLQQMDDNGNQILLNYRVRPTANDIAVKVPLKKLLNGEVNPESIRDRMVIIGVIESSGDYWATPYGVQGQAKTSGVYLQAQMASQMISAVLDGRPMIWVWPQWGEALCIFGGAIAGSLLAWSQLMRTKQAVRLGLLCLVSVGGLVGVAWAALIIGGWLPLVPTLLTFGGGALSTTVVLAGSRDP